MKDITTIIDGSTGENCKPDYSHEQKVRIKHFVISVFQLFPDYRGDLKSEDNIKAYCRIHADDIALFTPESYQDRLKKVSKLVASQNLKDLVGNYKNAIHALAAAAGDMEKLNHDYRTVYPNKTKVEGGLLKIKHLDSQASDQETANKEIDKIKGLLR